MSERDEGHLPRIAANPGGLPVRRHGCARRGRLTDTYQPAPAPACPAGEVQ
jgi:hypothetical protein